MKFGIREVCNLTYRAKTSVKIGNKIFAAGQPVLIIDSAKTSTLEGAGTTVYATGGRGNTRLIAWEGEKTLTFTVEDALISPIGLSILTGAGLIKKQDNEYVHVHQTFMAMVDASKAEIDLTEALGTDRMCEAAPLFVLATDNDGGLTGDIYQIVTVEQVDGKNPVRKIIIKDEEDKAKGTTVIVDCYIKKAGSSVSEIQIDAENFAGYYYVEGDTYFRAQGNGKDMPAIITLPNVKIQSNFTFTMASSGDPSTFTYTMDAFPGYTYFNKTKKVLCLIQIIEESKPVDAKWDTVMEHKEDNEEQIIIDEETNIDKDSFDGVSVPTFAAVTFTANGKTIDLIDNTITVPADATGDLELALNKEGFNIRDDVTIPVTGISDTYKTAYATTIYSTTDSKKSKTYTWYAIKAKAAATE